MPRLDVNRSGEMEAFVHVVDRGSFSEAAHALDMTPSAVSKLIARLEARLGVQLLHRSTRKLTLTTEGRAFYDRGVRVLADLDEAERAAAADATPRGRVSVNASVAFGHHVLVPLVPRLVEQHPLITLDLSLTDRIIDLIEERTDIAVRWGELPPSELVARRLGETGQLIVGSPAYLARHGTPRTPEQLEQHHRLSWSYRRSVAGWPLQRGGRAFEIAPGNGIRAADGETLRQLALAGVGLARLSRYHVQADLDAKRLVPVLEKHNPHELSPIHAVYVGKTGHLPARVRAVLDFLERHAQVDAKVRRKG
ncbi:Transcriptional regulator, LysR family protein [Minicystis rosea]|nr:Transcriptional regulator, LysR family protein [Minicystis rosea]